MDSFHRLPAEIARALERGSTVVTGNQRAARTLRLHFDRQSRANGLTRWRPPEIYAWDTWTLSLWRELLLGGNESRLLLNRSQELRVWSSIIVADEQWSSLQTVESLATMAADAWRLLCQYRSQQRLKAVGVSGDTRAFQRWAERFMRRCQTDGYLAQSELEEALTQAAAKIVSGRQDAGGGIVLTGFDRLTPAQQTLVNTLRASGVTVEEQLPRNPADKIFLGAADDLSSELEQAAAWVKQFLEGEPGAHVAIIVPDARAERGGIERSFRAVLAPELQDITASALSKPFEFSLGVPLAQVPMVLVAMDLARWVTGPLPLAKISRLLTSPYFAGGEAEKTARAEFDAFGLRRLKLLRPELDLEQFVAHAAVSRYRLQLGGLLNRMRAISRAAAKVVGSSDSAGKQKPWAEWAESIRQILDAAGWTDGPQLDSVEFQTREKWESALDELAGLDFEGTRPTFPDALNTLEGMLQRTLFAPESHGAPVQIMSPQEAAGSHFEAVYFLRATDAEWPHRPGMSPLLGWRLQRDLGMPGSDAAADHEHARHMTHRLAASAKTIVFSYTKETADGRQRPSPLLQDFKLQPLEPVARTTAEPVELQLLAEDFVPLANLSVRGGADLLKQQAACPFRAFAEKRLWSSELKTRDLGLDAGERGDVVHRTLEHFWGEVKTQARLNEMTAVELGEQLDRSIEDGLRRTTSGSGVDEEPWDTAYRAVQRRRLRRLLVDWLEIERRRPPFSVELREARFDDVPVGPLRLSIRFDRIDQTLDTGQEVLLDYKTSAATPTPWLGERPDEPQLPLYAILREPHAVGAVAFARLRPGKQMELNGLEANEGLLPKTSRTKLSLDAQIEEWREVLNRLAEDFASGEASVTPKQYPLTCKHCGQRTLCRLDPATLRGEYDEDEPVTGEVDV